MTWWHTLRRLIQGRVPGQLVIQITDFCNARCPQCGMRTTHRFARSTLAIDAVKKIIDAAAQKGVQAVSFTGGEPLLFLDDLVELIRYAGSAGIPMIRTGTNGFFMREPKSPDFGDRVNRVVDALADTPLRNFWISIDSADPAMHNTMRGFSDLMAGISLALPVFHARGIYPAANLGINRNLSGSPLPMLDLDPDPEDMVRFYHAYRTAFRRFYRFVADLGFTMVNTCYPMSVAPASRADGLDPVYAATAGDAVVRFSRQEKALLFHALLKTVGEFRSRLRIFSPRCSLYRLSRIYAGDGALAYPCRGGIDFFFVDARRGDTYPCGYRGNENFGPFSGVELARTHTGKPCHQCDWECFRDPSELLGPLLHLAEPMRLLRAVARDRTFSRLWLEDLAYYRACGFFHGRHPPDSVRLDSYRGGKGVDARRQCP